MRYLHVIWLLTSLHTPFCLAAQAGIDQLKQHIASARNQGNLQQAEQLSDSLLETAIALNDVNAQAQAYYEFANNAMERNIYPLARQHLEQTLALLPPDQVSTLQAKALRRLGMVYRYQSDYDTALKYVYQAMQIFQTLEDQAAIASTYSSIGVILEKMGQLEEALKAHQQSLNLHQQLGNTENVASAIYNLGDLYRVLGDNEQAMQYFLQSLQLDIASDDKRNIAYSHNKLGFLYAALGELDKAAVHANQALSLFQQIGALRDTEWARTVVAKVAMEQGDYTTAQQLLDTVMLAASTHHYNSLLVDTYRMAAELALRQQDDTAALSYLEPAITLAQQNHERADEALLQKMRVDVYSRQERVAEAFAALQAQKQLEDDIFSSKRAATIAAIQAQTNYSLQQNQLELLQNKQQLQQAQLEQQQLARNFWIVGLCAVFVLLISLYRRLLQSRQNRLLEQQVAARTTELKLKNDELERAYQQLETISLTDKLTGLHNRHFIDSQIESELEHYRRVQQDWQTGKTVQPENAELALFIIDLDHFKRLNDTYGHDVGDAVLQQLGQIMRQVFRQSDYLVRWGGEEFIALARGINRDDAGQLAQRFVTAVATSIIQGDGYGPFYITCSVGYVCYPLPLGNTVQHWPGLLKLADICLYAAKYSGRNGWVGIPNYAAELPVSAQLVSAVQIQHWIEEGKLQVQHSFSEALSWQQPQ